jgi:hypothetical protein
MGGLTRPSGTGPGTPESLPVRQEGRAHHRRARPIPYYLPLQPGTASCGPGPVPWLGSWHFAPPSCGPLLLLPGPKSGSATADAGIARAPAESRTAKPLRIFTSPRYRHPPGGGLSIETRERASSWPIVPRGRTLAGSPGDNEAGPPPRGWGRAAIRALAVGASMRRDALPRYCGKT